MLDLQGDVPLSMLFSDVGLEYLKGPTQQCMLLVARPHAIGLSIWKYQLPVRFQICGPKQGRLAHIVFCTGCGAAGIPAHGVAAAGRGRGGSGARAALQGALPHDMLDMQPHVKHRLRLMEALARG